MQSVIGALRVILGADTAQFDSGMDRAQAKLASVGKRMQQVGANIAKVGASLTVGLTAPIIAAGTIAVREATEMQHAIGQVNAALKSMGDGAGRSFDQLATQAERLSATSLFEDDEILTKVTANMLTFGNIAGAQFDRAQQAALNLSARMDGDLQGAALRVGKALNDPTKGLAALTKVGIQFTDQQKAQIKAMQASGNMAGAQAIMLKELERQFGGAAAAARAADPMAAAMMDIKNALGELGAVILPVVAKIASGISQFMQRIGELSPAGQKMVVVGALIAAALGPVLVAVGALITAFGAILPVLGVVGAALGAFALPIAAVVAILAGLAFAFKDDIVPAMQFFAKTLQEVLGPKIAPLVEAAKAMFAQFAGAMRGFFGDGQGSILPLLKVVGTVVARVFGAIVDIITASLRVVTNLMGALGALLRGDYSAMWSYLGKAVSAVVDGVGKAFTTLLPNVSKSIVGMYNAVKDWLGRKLTEVITGVIQKVESVGRAFYELYDAVVGHSYVPDMVEGVAEWMAKLDAGMVVPARNATTKAKEAFQELRDDVADIMEGLLTDAERRTRDIATQIATLNRAVRAGIMTRREADNAIQGVQAETFDTPDRIGPLGQMASGVDIQRELKEGLMAISDKAEEVRERMREAGQEFGLQFSDVVQQALRGDIKGVFLDMLGSVLDNLLQKLGQTLFASLNNMSGGKSGGGFWSTIGNALMSAVGGKMGVPAAGGKKAPAFNNGGSFKIGGNPGIDNNLISFWGSKGETVDIHKAGNDRGGAAGALMFDLRGAVMTSDLLQQMQTMANQSGGMAFAGARQVAPADAARAQTYSRKR